jgi:hypothetical protein
MSTLCALALLLATPLPRSIEKHEETPPPVVSAYLDDEGRLFYEFPCKVVSVSAEPIRLPDGSVMTHWNRVETTCYFTRTYPLCRVCAYEVTGNVIEEEQLRRRLKRSCKIMVARGDRVLRPEVLHRHSALDGTSLSLTG